MLMPGNVVKVYKKEVLDNLVSGWNKVGFLFCKIYMGKTGEDTVCECRKDSDNGKRACDI